MNAVSEPETHAAPVILPEQGEGNPTRPDAPGPRPLSVLYIDDNPNLLDVIRIILEQVGNMVVATCDSGACALALLKKQEFDVVISDYDMPEMNGMSVLKRVRASGNQVPFILFTGYARDEIAANCLEDMGGAYLKKCVSPPQLIPEVEKRFFQLTTGRSSPGGAF
ncbi:MAG: response regulator [Methanoregulaceae archaeon]